MKWCKRASPDKPDEKAEIHTPRRKQGREMVRMSGYPSPAVQRIMFFILPTIIAEILRRDGSHWDFEKDSERDEELH